MELQEDKVLLGLLDDRGGKELLYLAIENSFIPLYDSLAKLVILSILYTKGEKQQG